MTLHILQDHNVRADDASDTDRTTRAPSEGVRVVIVAEHASARFGGEAVLPLHYFRLLRARGVEAWLVVHTRTREELQQLLPQEIGRIHFIPDLWVHKVLWRISERLPRRVAEATCGAISHFVTQVLQRRIVKRLVREHAIDVVHEPIPVSPKQPSMMFGVGAPVVIGPMNGGMRYPPGFVGLEGRPTRAFVGGARAAASVLNTIAPGKRRAAALLVANRRTRDALPAGVRCPIVELCENGVDLSLWRPAETSRTQRTGPTRFTFLGRLVDWKGVDLLLEAMARVPRHDIELQVVGDGPVRSSLEAQARGLGLDGRVVFRGFVPQHQCPELLAASDVLVLPSLYECGGAVVLEAMAMALPVIATRWGGPADYLDDRCAILVDPSGREAFIDGLAAAISTLSESPELRRQLGLTGRRRVVEEFNWERKIDRMLGVYANVQAAQSNQVT